MKILLGWFLCASMMLASVLSPLHKIEAGGIVQNIALVQNEIIVGTSAGTLDVYSAHDAHKVFGYTFEKIKDFTGDEVAPKVFSVDALKGRFIAVVQASNGARELYSVSKGKAERIIAADKNWFIAKARFVDERHVLIALLSNEVILWDMAEGKALYQYQVNPSHFSDFALNDTKTLVALSCESGEISIADVRTGKITKVLKGGNVDNVYKVDFKKSAVSCAGQDRRGIVYELNSGAYERYDGSFLIYAGALSPSEALVAFASNEENDIVVFHRATKAKHHILKGQKSTLNTIIFASEKELISSSDDATIMIWRLP